MVVMKDRLWKAETPNVDTPINDLSCFGVLGGCLAEALSELERQQSSAIKATAVATERALLTKEGNADPAIEFAPASLQITPEVATRTMNALGRAMGKFQSGSWSSATTHAPSALLRGRVDHFNRRNTKWRIIVRDGQFQRRADLDKNRRMRERPSLWEVSKEKEKTSIDPTKLSLELLAFNDFE